MIDAYIVSLCRDYIEAVDAMRSGLYTTEEIQVFDSQRILVHDELCRLLALDRSVDMYRRAKAILLHAKGGNIQ